MTSGCVRRCVAVTAVVCGVFGAQLADAQSLGEIARREAERRSQVTSGRVYTDADLVPVDPPQAPVVPPAAGTGADSIPIEASAGADAAPPDASVRPALKPSEKRDEQYWRSQAHALRGRLAKAEADAARTEARLAEIDGRPQTPATMREREIVAKAVAQFQRNVGFLRQDLARFDAFAQSRNVPTAWIR